MSPKTWCGSQSRIAAHFLADLRKRKPHDPHAAPYPHIQKWPLTCIYRPCGAKCAGVRIGCQPHTRALLFHRRAKVQVTGVRIQWWCGSHCRTGHFSTAIAYKTAGQTVCGVCETAKIDITAGQGMCAGCAGRPITPYIYKIGVREKKAECNLRR